MASLFAIAYKSGSTTHPGYRVRVDPNDHKMIMWVSAEDVNGLRVISTLRDLESLPLDERVAIPKSFAQSDLGWGP